MTIEWESTSQFTVPEDSTGYLIWQVVRVWQRQLEADLAPLDITHLQFVLLAAIGWLTRQEDLVTQARLAEFCKIDVMQISQVASKLEAKALIHRAVHPNDTRAKVLTLTANGESVLERALPIVEGFDADFFDRGDRSILNAELRKLL